jgi:DNA-binding response OmpR family regulator
MAELGEGGAVEGDGLVRDGEAGADGDGGGGGVVDGGVEAAGGGAAAARSSGAEARSGVAVCSTGWSATVATPMLTRVAAHHPSTGIDPRSRMWAIQPSTHMVNRMAMILLVEDDRIVAAALTRALVDAGHVVRAATQATHALRVVADERPDVVILDLGLPDIDGADALRMMRSVSDVPVIVATARRSEVDIINLLNAGADDYVTKPFSSGHLLARIAAVQRRGRPVPAEAPRITVGSLVVDPQRREVRLDGAPIRLTRREFDVLAYLAGRVGRVVSRRELLTQVWQQDRMGEEQTIDVHISWLRRKLGETAARPRFLHTVRGVGVKLVEPEPPAPPAGEPRA